MKHLKILGLLGCLSANLFGQSVGNPDVQLQLPPCIYAVPGIEMNVYFDNIVRVINSGNYVFDVDCPKGRNDQKRWRFTPMPSDVGEYDWKVRVINESGVVAEGTMKLHVSPADAGEGKAVSILIIGDSLTNAWRYPKRLLDLTLVTGNPKLTMVGSNGMNYKPQPGGLAYEGWGGWSWATFAQRAEPIKSEKPEPRFRASPFIVKKDGKSVLDFQQYFDTYNEGRAPDVITFQLGVNDVFGATDENLQKSIDSILKSAETLLAAARKAAPDAVFGVGLVTRGAGSQDAFGKDYACGNTRWQYTKNQHALNAAMLKKFVGGADKKLFIIPTNLNLDCENNFPKVKEEVSKGNEAFTERHCNGVHPAPAGYRQIGDTFYSWLKFCLAEQDKAKK